MSGAQWLIAILSAILVAGALAAYRARLRREVERTEPNVQARLAELENERLEIVAGIASRK